MTRLFRLGALAFTSLVIACGSSSESGPTRYGTIFLESDSTAEPAQLAKARFYQLDSTPAAGPCRVVGEQGACRLWECRDYSPLEALDTSPLSAGSLSVTGANVELELEEGEPGSYTWQNTLAQPLWNGGERLLARVGGSAEFPAAEVALSAPDPIQITAPVVSERPWLVDAHADLGFGWTSAVGSIVYVAISIVVADPESGTKQLFPGLDCAFAGTANAAVVPAALLSAVAKPEGGAGHLIEALTLAVESVRVDDAVLTLRATSFAFSELATLE